MASEATVPAAPASSAASGLRPNAVGLAGVLFQAVALIGPGVALAFGSGPGITYAGGSFPLALALAMVGCLLLALNISQLAVHLPSAGGFYTFISRGLGRSLGFLAGWVSIAGYLVFLPLNLIAFGYGLQSASGPHGRPDLGVPWWIFAIVLAVVMALLTWIGVRLSLRTLVVLGGIEVLVFLALSIYLVATANDNTGAAFTPAQWGPNSGGLVGVLAGTAIAFLFFSGFESSAMLAEEARAPRRNVPRAMILSVIAIGIFFVLASYAGLAGYGFNIGGFLSDKSGSAWFTLGGKATQALGIGNAGQDIVQLVVLTSLAANYAAGYTALARVVFAMGRSGALPSAFGRVSKRFRTPTLAIFAGAPVSLGIAVWSAAVYGAQPPNSFEVIIHVASYCVIAAYVAVSLAVPFFYRREHPGEFNPLRHMVIPVLAVLLLLGVLVAQFVTAIRPAGFPGLAPQYLGAIFAGGWLLLGVIWLLVLRVRKPAALEAGEKLYVEPSE